MKEKFKLFVKENPELIDYVKENKISWQSLYEVYSLYGEDKKIWDKYKTNNKGIDELIKMVKSINLDNLKNIIEGLEKAISIIQNLVTEEDNKQEFNYKPKYEDLDD